MANTFSRYRLLVTPAIALIIVTNCSYLWLTAEKRMRQLCQQIPLNMSYAKLQQFSQQHNLTPPQSPHGDNRLLDKSVRTPLGCQLQLHNGLVSKVSFYQP